MLSSRNTLAAVFGAALLAATLTGCSISIDDPAQPSTSDNSASGPSTSDNTSTEDAAEPDTGASGELSDENAAAREEYIAEASTTMPCPNGTPLIAHGEVIRIEGPCSTLTINLDVGVVIADDVDELILNGHGTVVYTERLTTLTVTGDVNVVFWVGAAPALTNTGAGNVLARG